MSKNQRKIYVLFTGQLRTPALFERSLADLLELQAEGFIEGVIFSTWKGELRRAGFAVEKNLIVIESELIADTGTGNYKAQMKHYIEGLNYIYKFSKDCFVLKTRPDVHISKEFIKKIINLNLNIDIKFTKIFNYKIWVPWFEITKPFCLEDAYFFGEYNDMLKLYNLSNIYTRNNLGQGITHIRRFSFPFLDYFPTLAKFINNNYGLSKNLGTNYNLDQLPHAQRKYIVNLLVTYYFIVKTYFIVFSEKDAIFFSSKKDPSVGRPFIANNKKLDRNLSLSENNTNKYNNIFSNFKLDFDFHWLNNLINGNFNYDPISEEISWELYKILKTTTSFYFYKKGRDLKKKHFLEDAAKMYEYAIKHNNKFAWYYYELGETLTKLGRINQAIEAYKQAINIQPHSSLFRDSLGKILNT